MWTRLLKILILPDIKIKFTFYQICSMKALGLIIIACFIFSVTYTQNKEGAGIIIANGQMPNIARDKSNTIHVVYGTGDSILYLSSRDGKSFTPPVLIAGLPKLFAFAMRGPQIAVSNNG